MITKQNIMDIIGLYLKIYPDEKEKLDIFIKYLQTHSDEQITDWNNFEGHIVATTFVYAKKEKKFLVLYHKDLQTFLNPGGHADPEDENVLATAIRELKEETGLQDFKLFSVSNNEMIPFDMAIHTVRYNQRLDLPSHYHFDFRYLIVIDKIVDIKIDEEESGEYKWLKFDEVKDYKSYKTVITKLQEMIKEI